MYYNVSRFQLLLPFLVAGTSEVNKLHIDYATAAGINCTRNDIKDMRTEVTQKLCRLERHFHEEFTQLADMISLLEGEVEANIENLRIDVTTRLDKLEEQFNNISTTMLASLQMMQSTFVAAQSAPGPGNSAPAGPQQPPPDGA